jgi:hypothetical protein
MEYRARTTITLNAELDILREIKELCEKERKSLSEKVNELFIGELEKKAVGEANPIKIPYGLDREKPSYNKHNPLQTLDDFITDGLYTSKTWQPIFSKIENNDQLQKYENLLTTMNTAAKDRHHFIKTGKTTIRSGRMERIPIMDDLK